DAPTALRRELEEELGVEVEPSRRVHCVRWPESHRTLVLDGWRVRVCAGRPRGLQGQALRWAAIEKLHELPMPPADAPLCSAIRLDQIMWITPELSSERELPAWLTGVDARLEAGVRLVQLRLPGVDAELLQLVAAALSERCRAVGARWLLNGNAEWASVLKADGLHLSSPILRRLAQRPAPRRLTVGASCHDAHELKHAARLGLDYATLSPLRETRTHADARPLGDAGFAALARHCPIPVFALGGVSTADLDHVRALGAFGLAGIRGV
ncbi:MAG: Nudix family hydrolase, partial [Lysobacterales bacterium]